MPDPHTPINSDGTPDLTDKTVPTRVYRNPTPVVVLLIPVRSAKGIGLLVIERNLEIGRGELALPGGYQDYGEPWRRAGAREAEEEAQVIVDEHSIRVQAVEDSTGCKHIVIVGLADPIDEADLPPFEPSEEVSDRRVIYSPQELAFPSHTQQAKVFFEQIAPNL